MHANIYRKLLHTAQALGPPSSLPETLAGTTIPGFLRKGFSAAISTGSVDGIHSSTQGMQPANELRPFGGHNFLIPQLLILSRLALFSLPIQSSF